MVSEPVAQNADFACVPIDDFSGCPLLKGSMESRNPNGLLPVVLKEHGPETEGNVRFVHNLMEIATRGVN